MPDRVEEIGRQTADRLGGVFFWLRREMNVARILLRSGEPLQIDVVPLAGSLDDDLRRRDFTLNAMAVSPQSGLVPGAAIIDPTGGQQDLAQRRLRLAGPDALEQDPLRCLRAFRLRARLGLSFDPSRLSSPFASLCLSLYETRSFSVNPSCAVMKLTLAHGLRPRRLKRSPDAVTRDASSGTTPP